MTKIALFIWKRSANVSSLEASDIFSGFWLTVAYIKYIHIAKQALQFYNSLIIILYSV